MSDFLRLVGSTRIDRVMDYISDKYSEIYQFTVSNPLLSVFVIITLTILSVLVWKYLVIKLRSPSKEFLMKIEDCDSITVLMHNNPDPDSMACAMAVDRLSEKVETETQIAYPGKISHDENRAFRAVLDVKFENITKSEEINGDKLVVVDHQLPRGLEDVDTIIPDIVIDHHPIRGGISEEETDFWYVDSDLGACSSILTKFLFKQGVLNKSNNKKVETNLATALYYGIKSDTNNLSRNVSELDFNSINNLYDFIDSDKLHRISNPKIDTNCLETKARSIMGRNVREPFAVSDVGEVQNTDSIPQAADELIKLEGISAVIVIGTTGELIRLSGRAYDDRIHLGDALRRSFGDISGFNVGGHARMAGGSISKESLRSEGMSRKELKEKLFDVMNGN